MVEQEDPIVIDLDKNKDELVKEVSEILKRYSVYLKEGDIALSFVLRKAGSPDRHFDYKFTQEEFDSAEKDIVFPVVVKEILKKEFPEKISNHPKLVKHVMNELQKDPYWSNNIIKLLDAIEAQR